MSNRIHLSKAAVTSVEEQFVMDALRSGWIAPLGPHVDAFEAEVAERVGVAGALALSSGTAALHLALLHVGARPDTVVVLSSLTFAATANAVAYTGATPVFIDAQLDDANIDEELMLNAVRALQGEGADVVAALPVDLFGRCCDYAILEPGLGELGVPLIEDAAEALGAVVDGRAAGSFGRAAALSFNGNKIMTTSGGGMLLSNDSDLLDRARHLATQAREPVPWYEHTEVGYNYRLSNILAALGRGQLRRLDEMIDRRGEIRQRYGEGLRDLPGVRLLAGGDIRHQDNHWLTCAILDSDLGLPDADTVVAHMSAADIETRHLWKPMHLQPAFAQERCFTTGAGEQLFAQGVALPSGAALTDYEVDRVIDNLREVVS